MHNADFIKEKGLKIGDHIIIQKAGDVIPEIVKSLIDKRTGNEIEFQMPTVCPVCGMPAIREEGEAATRCIGIECPARNLRNIIHFVSKEGMNIVGLGDKIVETLLDKKLIENIADIYYLKLEDIKGLKKDGTKFATNLIDAIEKSKQNSLDKLITALGIRNVGTKLAKILATKFKTIDNLMNATMDELYEIDDIGEVTAKSIYDLFKQSQTKDLIDKLKNANVNMETTENQNIDDRFSGKTFVLTGSLENYTREEASRIIESFGGKTSSSVSKKTDFVLAGSEAREQAFKSRRIRSKDN